jgi:hypothetical protein
MSRATAYKLMRVADRLGSEFLENRNLPLGVLYVLAESRTPEHIVDGVAQGLIPPSEVAIRNQRAAWEESSEWREQDSLRADGEGHEQSPQKQAFLSFAQAILDVSETLDESGLAAWVRYWMEQCDDEHRPGVAERCMTVTATAYHAAKPYAGD